jgi:hypothetical protein
MRPQYWIGIFATLGTIIGITFSIIFDLNNIVTTIACTIIGVVVGTFRSCIHELNNFFINIIECAIITVFSAESTVIS